VLRIARVGATAKIKSASGREPTFSDASLAFSGEHDNPVLPAKKKYGDPNTREVYNKKAAGTA
jgi:hypothetical protein